MRSRVALIAAVSALVLLGGVAPVVGLGGNAALGLAGSDAPTDRAVPSDDRTGPSDDPDDRTDATAAQYEVSLENVTIQTWLLRNSTVRNATVEEVVIRNATTENGVRENVTMTGVTVGEFALERARLQNVTADRLVVRNKSVLDVPGGDFVDPEVSDRTIERHWTRNATVAGVVIDRIVVDAAILCQNASLGDEAEDASQFDPQASDDDPAVSVEGGEVGEALVIRGHASGWAVESIDRPDAEDGSLPGGCDRE